MRTQPVGQRRGARANFFETPQRGVVGAARKAILADVLARPDRWPALAEQVRVQVRVRGRCRDATVDELAQIDIARLEEVRRPAAWARRGSPAGLSVVSDEVEGNFHVWTESGLERAHLVELAWGFDGPVVTQFAHLSWLVVGGVVGHVPDLLQHRPGARHLMIDCRPSERRSGLEFRCKVALTSATCALLGWGYELWDDPGGQRVRNLRHLSLFAKVPAQVAEVAADVSARAGLDYTSVAGFLRRSGERIADPAVLYHALFARMVWTDLDQPISLPSPLRAVPEPGWCAAPWRQVITAAVDG